MNRGERNQLLDWPDCGSSVFCQYPVQTRLRNFLLSLPERGLRSATALAGGLLREVGDVAIPKTDRRGQLYRNLVEATLRFLIEQVGQVKDVYPGEEKLTEDFLVRRAVGNGIELIGIPEKARWLSASAPSAARYTGTAVAAILLEDYRASLKQIRETGYLRYAVDCL